MRPLLLVLAALAGAPVPQDPAARIRDLVQRLRDDSIDEREKSERELVELGKAAVPELQKLKDSEDHELRARVLEILKTIERNAVLGKYYPAFPPITLEGKPASAAEALGMLSRKTGEAWRLDPAEFAGPVGELRVRGATYWEALDAVCAAAGTLSYAVGDEGPVFSRKRPVARPSVRKEAIRTSLESLEVLREFDFTGTTQDYLVVALQTAWAPGVKPVTVEHRLTEVLDGQGNLLEGGERLRFDAPRGRMRRDEFRLPLAGPPEDVKRIARVKGEASLYFPVSSEEAVIDVTSGGGSTRLEDVVVTIRGVRLQKDFLAFELICTFSGGAAVSADRHGMDTVGVENDRRETLAAKPLSPRTMHRSRTSATTYQSWSAALPAGRTAARVRVGIVRETVEKEVPFEFTDLPLE